MEQRNNKVPVPLPLEMHREILKHVDGAALAKCSRVSSSFRALASEYLYRDLRITGFSSLSRFLNNHVGDLSYHHRVQIPG